MKDMFAVLFKETYGKEPDYNDRVTKILYEFWCDGYSTGYGVGITQ